MGIIIGFPAGRKAVAQELWVNVEHEVIDYLISLSDEYHLDLLINLNPYDVALISYKELSFIISEMDKLLIAAKEYRLPLPPELIGMEGDDIDFGWSGLIEFLLKIRDIMTEAVRLKSDLIAVGD